LKIVLSIENDKESKLIVGFNSLVLADMGGTARQAGGFTSIFHYLTCLMSNPLRIAFTTQQKK
jgi:hypothetical protein